VPALLTAAGREGLFVWDASNLSAMVSADPLQAIYVAPSSDPTGASGAWVRKFTGRAESSWWGVSTSATAANNSASFGAALATLKCLAIAGYGYNQGSIGLHTPAGRYQFNNSITIDHALEVTGDYTGSGGGTVFEWTAAVHGFVLAGFDGSSVHSNGAKIRGFFLQGNNGGTAKHAISQTGYGNVEDVFCKD